MTVEPDLDPWELAERQPHLHTDRERDHWAQRYNDRLKIIALGQEVSTERIARAAAERATEILADVLRGYLDSFERERRADHPLARKIRAAFAEADVPIIK